MNNANASRRLTNLHRHFTTSTKYYDWTQHQSKLPRLPLPTLELTLQRYLESVKPLQTKKAHSRTISVVNSFLQNQGKTLHAELNERNQHSLLTKESTSYVRPFWNDMYLKGRYPLPINSNPYLIFPKDPLHTTQESRAAFVACGFAQFWLAKHQNRLPPDVNNNGTPNCMDEYARLFSSARIPHLNRDTWKETPEAKHIVVLHGPNIYKVDVIDDHGVISEEALQRILKEDILSLSLSSSSSSISRSQSQSQSQSQHYLGDLSTLGRDQWTEIRTQMNLNPKTLQSINTIDDAMFVLALDLETSPTEDDFVSVALHGGHHNGTQEHRWYDKTCLIVNPKGQVAYNFEHSLYDGAAMRRLCDELHFITTNQSTEREKWNYKWSANTKPSFWKATCLDFNLDASLLKSIDTARKIHIANQKQVNVVQGSFLEFGKNTMKTFKTSPDGLLQAVYKLVYARVHGWTPNEGIYVYESCQTKGFLCGRTEVIRTTTSESNAFVDYMMHGQVDPSVAAALLRASASKHSQVAKLASMGQGCDRHLFALLRLAEAKCETTGDALPEFFLDTAWSLSNNSILSTSNLSSEAFHGMGFGPVVHNGYGIAYGINKEALYFGISNFILDDENIGNKGGGFGGVGSNGNGNDDNDDDVEGINELIATDSVLFRKELFKTLREVRDIFLNEK